MSKPWRREVAAWTLAGVFVSGPVSGVAYALALADSTATVDSTKVAPPSPPAPSLQAQLKAQPRSKTRAWVTIGSGLALSVGSFLVATAADQAYDDYLGETNPDEIEGHYQDAKTLDKVSAGMLIAGQAAIALGLYWGFIQRPAEAPVRTFGIAPDFSSGRAGVAIVVPLP